MSYGERNYKSITWSILLPTVPNRRGSREKLLEVLEPQVAGFPDVELLVLEDNLKRDYGSKMQSMIDIAQGVYLSFVDDDDLVSKDYVKRLRAAMNGGVDSVGLTATITLDNKGWTPVYCSIFNEWRNDPPNGYWRGPTHITPIKADLVRKVKWEGHWGADSVWSKKMMDLGLLKTENTVKGAPVYYYYAMGDNNEGVWI